MPIGQPVPSEAEAIPGFNSTVPADKVTIVVDDSGFLAAHNLGAASFFGLVLKPGQRGPNVLDLVAEADRPRAARELAACLRGSGQGCTRLGLLLGNNFQVEAEVQARPRCCSGRPSGLILTVRSISKPVLRALSA